MKSIKYYLNLKFQFILRFAATFKAKFSKKPMFENGLYAISANFSTQIKYGPIKNADIKNQFEQF